MEEIAEAGLEHRSGARGRGGGAKWQELAEQGIQDSEAALPLCYCPCQCIRNISRAVGGSPEQRRSRPCCVQSSLGPALRRGACISRNSGRATSTDAEPGRAGQTVSLHYSLACVCGHIALE